MRFLSSALSSISVQARVKCFSLSLIGISAIAGITCEELSGAKISGLFSQLGSLIPWKKLGGGGRKLVKVLVALLME